MSEYKTKEEKIKALKELKRLGDKFGAPTEFIDNAIKRISEEQEQTEKPVTKTVQEKATELEEALAKLGYKSMVGIAMDGHEKEFVVFARGSRCTVRGLLSLLNENIKEEY